MPGSDSDVMVAIDEPTMDRGMAGGDHVLAVLEWNGTGGCVGRAGSGVSQLAE